MRTAKRDRPEEPISVGSSEDDEEDSRSSSTTSSSGLAAAAGDWEEGMGDDSTPTVKPHPKGGTTRRVQVRKFAQTTAKTAQISKYSAVAQSLYTVVNHTSFITALALSQCASYVAAAFSPHPLQVPLQPAGQNDEAATDRVEDESIVPQFGIEVFSLLTTGSSAPKKGSTSAAQDNAETAPELTSLLMQCFYHLSSVCYQLCWPAEAELSPSQASSELSNFIFATQPERHRLVALAPVEAVGFAYSLNNPSFLPTAIAPCPNCLNVPSDKGDRLLAVGTTQMGVLIVKFRQSVAVRRWRQVKTGQPASNQASSTAAPNISNHRKVSTVEVLENEGLFLTLIALGPSSGEPNFPITCLSVYPHGKENEGDPARNISSPQKKGVVSSSLEDPRHLIYATSWESLCFNIWDLTVPTTPVFTMPAIEGVTGTGAAMTSTSATGCIYCCPSTKIVLSQVMPSYTAGPIDAPIAPFSIKYLGYFGNIRLMAGMCADGRMYVWGQLIGGLRSKPFKALACVDATNFLCQKGSNGVDFSLCTFDAHTVQSEVWLVAGMGAQVVKGVVPLRSLDVK